MIARALTEVDMCAALNGTFMEYLRADDDFIPRRVRRDFIPSYGDIDFDRRRKQAMITGAAVRKSWRRPGRRVAL